MSKRSSAKEAMRERILETADRLFYVQGIRAVGVDTVAAKIGISKRTLYNYFHSKDELVAGYLSRRSKPIPEPDLPPAEQILGFFDHVERRLASVEFRGCPFVNAAAELGDPMHPGHKIAFAFKEGRRLWFRERLSLTAAPDPDGLATQMNTCATLAGSGLKQWDQVGYLSDKPSAATPDPKGNVFGRRWCYST